VRSGGRAVERRTDNRGDGGSIPPTAVSKIRQYRLPYICLCLSEETIKAGGPFYMVTMPGEVKVYFCSLGPHLEKPIKMFTYDDQTTHGVSTISVLRVRTCHVIKK